MNSRAQLDLVNSLIVEDTISIAELESIIAAHSAPESEYSRNRSVRLNTWKEMLATLRRGLEGLQLKRDALADLGSPKFTPAARRIAEPAAVRQTLFRDATQR